MSKESVCVRVFTDIAVDRLCCFYTQEVQKSNLQLLTVQNATSLLEPSTQAVDGPTTQNVQRPSCTGPAAGEMSLDSSMTDDESSRVDVLRPRRQRRHCGADDVFPTRAIQKSQVLAVYLCYAAVVCNP